LSSLHNQQTKFFGLIYIPISSVADPAGLLLDPDQTFQIGTDPDPLLYKICTNFSQLEMFGPKLAFKSYLRKKVYIRTCTIFLSIYNTFKDKKSLKCLSFSSLESGTGSGPKLPDPTKKVRIRNTAYIRHNFDAHFLLKLSLKRQYCCA
jgi:hypothetical protein